MRPAARALANEPDKLDWSLDRASPVPLYAQIKQRLIPLVATWPDAAQKFYTEDALGGLFAVNRLTVRRALQELVAEGFLVRLRRAGTFVRRAKVEEHFTPRMDFLDQWASRGHRTSARALTVERQRASDVVAQRLGLAPGAPVVYIRRQRFVGRVPMSLDDRWLPADLGAAFTAELVEGRSLLDVLWRQVELSHCDLQIEATAARGDAVKLLKVVPEAPLLERELRYFARDGRAVMYGRSLYRADLVRHAVRVRLRPGGLQDEEQAFAPGGDTGRIVWLPGARRKKS